MRSIAFLGTALLVATPALAQPAAPGATASPAAPTATPAAPPPQAQKSPQAQAKGAEPSKTLAQNIDQRIATMHRQLHITADQEPAWDKVAQVMRQNAADIEQAFHERAAGVEKMNAVENLRDFATIEESRAQGLQRLVSAFEPLYASFSDAQKKTADSIFQRQQERAHARRQQAK